MQPTSLTKASRLLIQDQHGPNTPLIYPHLPRNLRHIFSNVPPSSTSILGVSIPALLIAIVGPRLSLTRTLDQSEAILCLSDPNQPHLFFNMLEMLLSRCVNRPPPLVSSYRLLALFILGDMDLRVL
jgi:hypothetical protein